MPRSLTKPVRQQGGSRVSATKTRPAPTGGLNTRDPVAQMAPNDAQELDNFFPRESDVITRNGSQLHCDTAVGERIKRLVEFERFDEKHLLAFAGGKIFDVTTDTPNELGDNFGSDYWTSATIANQMLLANGVDAMQRFDGTTLVAASFTGVDTDKLIFVHTHHNRILAIEKNSQTMWVAETVGGLAGAMSPFDFSLTGSFAGHLFALLTITRDGGSGPDDFLAALFSSGDCVIYAGTNPLNVNGFSRVGHFKFGRPISRFGFADMEGDVVCITERGYESVSSSIPFGKTATDARIISARIRRTVRAVIARSADQNDAWSLQPHGKGDMLIVNVPQGEATFVQHVMNINTKRWCRFTGLKASCWARLGTKLYMGTLEGRVMEYTGSDDDGRPIAVNALTAWDAFDSIENNKDHKLQQLVIETAYYPTIRTSLRCDYDFVPRLGSVTEFPTETPSGEWDEIEWDAVAWGRESTPTVVNTQNGGYGRVSAFRLMFSTRFAPLSWSSITYVYEPGDII